MSKNLKARATKKIEEGLARREEQIIEIVFDEFMKCLKQKPSFLPLIFFGAFFISLVSPRYAWFWFTRTFVYNLKGAEKLEPNRFEKIKEEVLPDEPDPQHSGCAH